MIDCAHASLNPQNDIEAEWQTALKRISDQMNLSSSVCAISIPAEDLFYRNIRVPFRERKKIRQILPFQLESNMPVSIEDLTIEFQPVNLPGSVDGTDLVTAAIKKEKLSRLLNVMESFHIKPRTVTISGYAAARVLATRETVPQHSLVVDMDASTCSIFLVISGEICFMRAFHVNTNSPNGSDLVGPHIQRSLYAFSEVSNFDIKPEVVYLAGNDFNGLHEDLSNVLNIAVRRADFTQYTVDDAGPLPDDIREMIVSSNAVALALTEADRSVGINFNREVFAGEKFWFEHKSRLIKTGLLALLVAFLAVVNIGLDIRHKQQKLSQIDTRIELTFRSAFPEVKKIVDPLHQMRLKVKEARKEALSLGASEKRMLAVDVLNDISQNIPQTMDIKLVRLSISPESILVSGNSDSFNTVDDMKNLLEKVPVFSAISISSTTKDKSGNRVNFKLKIQL